MDGELLFSNAIGLPEELVPTLVNSYVCEYASIKKDGTPITSLVIPFPGEDGCTVDVNTGLAYTGKAERARNNPKVSLLYSEPKGMIGERPPVILVYGRATVLDADLQVNTDRYARAIRAKSKLFRQIPAFMLQGMVGYIARIWIAITPIKVIWWPEGDIDKAPLEWLAPKGIRVRSSDPKPKPLPTAHNPLIATQKDWHRGMAYALDQLGEPVLTVVDAEGYPVPFRVHCGTLDNEGSNLDLFPMMPAEAKGRACLTFHSIQVRKGEMFSNENLSFIGSVSGDGERAKFKVERQLPSVSFKRGFMDMLSLGRLMLKMKKRLEVEAERRGQPVPAVRLQGR
ncbi:MAG: pyridoxamine 5'-phosphate oxidase family protein [Anaerolineales bacterium]|jgi:hypothetical protein